MAGVHSQRKPVLSAPSNIIREIEYRGYRIVQTDDTAYAGHIDDLGFAHPVVFVVIDEFDDIALPIGMHVHWSAHDAINAIEMKDTVAPGIATSKWPTTALYEYGVMRAYRRAFWNVMRAINNIQKLCTDARDFDDNPGEDVLGQLHLLRQNVQQDRSID